jgi:hypothetical protein
LVTSRKAFDKKKRKKRKRKRKHPKSKRAIRGKRC